jgi:hypothetical protein
LSFKRLRPHFHLAACDSRVPLFVLLLIFGSHGPIQQPPELSFPANSLLREFLSTVILGISQSGW